MEVLNYRLKNPPTRFIVVTVLLAAAIFAVDMSLPLGHVVWVPYVVLVLLCLWAPHRHYALVVAAACTVLMILGFLYCPPGISRRIALFNRAVGVVAIWITAFLCVMRRRTEEELGKSQTRLAGLIDSAMDAIVTINADQRIILFNPAAEKMFRCSADEVIGQSIDRFIPERFRNAHREHIRAFGETNVSKRSMGALGAIYGLRTDGEEFPIEASISQVVADGQKLYTVILRDISERRRA
jgi:PAS domain S-box-containing protein